MSCLRIASGIVLACAAVNAATTGSVPNLRLGDSVRPTHYAIELPLEPGKDTFTGVAVSMSISASPRTPFG